MNRFTLAAVLACLATLAACAEPAGDDSGGTAVSGLHEGDAPHGDEGGGAIELEQEPEAPVCKDRCSTFPESGHHMWYPDTLVPSIVVTPESIQVTVALADGLQFENARLWTGYDGTIPLYGNDVAFDRFPYEVTADGASADGTSFTVALPLPDGLACEQEFKVAVHVTYRNADGSLEAWPVYVWLDSCDCPEEVVCEGFPEGGISNWYPPTIHPTVSATPDQATVTVDVDPGFWIQGARLWIGRPGEIPRVGTEVDFDAFPYVVGPSAGSFTLTIPIPDDIGCGEEYKVAIQVALGEDDAITLFPVYVYLSTCCDEAPGDHDGDEGEALAPYTCGADCGAFPGDGSSANRRPDFLDASVLGRPDYATVAIDVEGFTIDEARVWIGGPLALPMLGDLPDYDAFPYRVTPDLLSGDGTRFVLGVPVPDWIACGGQYKVAVMVDVRDGAVVSTYPVFVYLDACCDGEAGEPGLVLGD